MKENGFQYKAHYTQLFYGQQKHLFHPTLSQTDTVLSSSVGKTSVMVDLFLNKGLPSPLQLTGVTLLKLTYLKEWTHCEPLHTQTRVAE